MKTPCINGYNARMFGCYRFFLATMVILAHSWPVHTGFSGNWTGAYAVFGFYMLSGYLMTLVLNERYGGMKNGLLRYFANRALRIYPVYWFVSLFSFLMVFYFPDITASVNPHFRTPDGLSGWASNLFIFGLEPFGSLFVPVAWSLNVELVFYIAIGLLFSRSGRLTALWFVLSLGYTVFMVMADKPFEERYFTVAAGSLPFSIGAVLYYIRDRVPFPKFIAVPAGLVFIVNIFYAHLLWDDVFTRGFYVSLAANTFFIASLTKLEPKVASEWHGRLDKSLGDLSYPVFLCHFNVMALILLADPFGTGARSPAMFFAALLLSALAGAIVHATVERRINSVRNSIRR